MLRNMHNMLSGVENKITNGIDVRELCKISLGCGIERLNGKKLIFSKDDRDLRPFDGWGPSPNTFVPVPQIVYPISDSRIVAAVDSSCIRIAETDEGALYAAKCGVAFASTGKPLLHFRIGPMLFYLSENGLDSSRIDHKIARLVLFDSDLAKRLIRVRVERSVQINLARHIEGGIILIDGSLRSSRLEEGDQSLGTLVEECSLNRNSLIGLSKSTRLKILSRLAVALRDIREPVCIDVGIIVKSMMKGLVGDNYLVKLSSTGPALRADLLDQDNHGLAGLIRNDSIAGGYPDSLRLAHHISTFSRTECMSLTSYVLANCNVTELFADDARASLLGSMPV